MPLPEALTDPVPLAALVLAAAAVLWWQKSLSWREYRAIHRVKLRVLPLLDRVWPHAVHAKGGPDDPEFLLRVGHRPREVFAALVDAGGSPHIVASVKERPALGAGTRRSVAHVVWTHEDGQQTEAFLFRADPQGRRTDVYAHFEPSVLDPTEHLDGEQVDGDPRGVVRAALDEEFGPVEEPDAET